LARDEVRRLSRKEEYARRRRLERISEVETAITEAEAVSRLLGQKLQEASHSEDLERIQSLSEQYTGNEEKLEKLLEEWENLAHEQSMA
jgi:hypothetical protein